MGDLSLCEVVSSVGTPQAHERVATEETTSNQDKSPICILSVRDERATDEQLVVLGTE